ncbi:MAG: DUF2066 domain-containing protein [Pseudomonadota bacterium]
MRSFRLFILMLSMSVIQAGQAAEKLGEKTPGIDRSDAYFFTVVLPYDRDIDRSSAVSDKEGVVKTAPSKSAKGGLQALDQAIALGMETLLVKITGQKSFLGSAVAKGYLKSPKYWLESYHIKPRTEEGVQVGQDIVLQFSAARLNAAFKNHRISIWPLEQRPKTLVMGSFLQKGELLKLTQDKMHYRVDIEFRDYPLQMALPISLPVSEDLWVFPVSPERSNSTISEVLLTTDHDYLLSFKLQALADSKYELSWYLFAPSGVVFAKGERRGAHQQPLLESMFEQVMQRYALFTEKHYSEAQEITLNVSNIVNTGQIRILEAQLKANQPMIKSARLLSIQSGLAQYRIEYQGDYQQIVDWIRQWQLTDFISQSQNLHQVDVKLNPNF